MRLLLVPPLVAGLLAGCSGTPCGALPALQAERQQERAAYAELVRPGTAPADVTERADEELHALERRVYDIEQECASR